MYFGSDLRLRATRRRLLAIVIRSDTGPTLRWSSRHLVLAAVAMLVASFRRRSQIGSPRRLLVGRVGVDAPVLVRSITDHSPPGCRGSRSPRSPHQLRRLPVSWPIFIFLTSERTGLDGVGLAILKVGITLALAVASYFLIEQPVRQRRWRLTLGPSVVIVAGIMLALLLATSVLHQAAATRDVVASPDLELSATDLAVGGAAAAPVVDRAAAPTSVPAPPLQRVLFLGDSLVHQSYATLAARMNVAGVQTEAIGGGDAPALGR